jgi:hypothetical protein
MSGKIGVLIIHGMGSQREGFSTGLREELQDRLGNLESRFEWEEIYWAKELKDREDVLWEWMQKAKNADNQPIDLDWILIRKFVVHNFGDAIAYHRDMRKSGSAYSLVHKVIDSSVSNLNDKLKDPKAPVIVLAHSLGAHMMSNYIWDQQHGTGLPFTPIPNLLAMITFGCNIPLFSLAFPVSKPINLPGKGVTNASLKKVSKWLNFLDTDDVLGWPLKTLYQKNLGQLTKEQKATVRRIVDDDINVGSLGTSWNPGAHTGYWTDNDFTRPVAKYLRQVAPLVP